jgi:hypothetical protein
LAPRGGCHATHALAADIVFDPVRGQGPKEINVRKPNSLQRHHSVGSTRTLTGRPAVDVGGVAISFALIMEEIMGFGRGLLLWLLGIPLPIIILLALFWR